MDFLIQLKPDHRFGELGPSIPNLEIEKKDNRSLESKNKKNSKNE